MRRIVLLLVLAVTSHCCSGLILFVRKDVHFELFDHTMFSATKYVSNRSMFEVDNGLNLFDGSGCCVLVNSFCSHTNMNENHCYNSLISKGVFEDPFCMLIFFLLVASFIWHLLYIKKKKDKKESENIRLRELLQQFITFSSRTMNEVRALCSLIQTPIESLLKKKWNSDAESDLVIVANNTNKLIALVKQLSDYNKEEIEKLELNSNSPYQGLQNVVVENGSMQINLSEIEPVSAMENVTLITVLLVDDNTEMLDLLSRNLGPLYILFAVHNGHEAVSLMQKQAVDVIVSDMFMPIMNGLGLLKYIKEDKMLCHIPFIILSACNSTEEKIKVLEAGADAYVEKPFSLAYLRAVINNQLAKRKVLFEYFESTPQSNYEKGGPTINDAEWLEDLNKLLHKNLTNGKFSIEMLVNELSTSRSSLQRKLKNITGLAPRDYARLYKLKLAAKLLSEGRYRINEVCFMSGFNNHSYFARCFKEQFGMLPKEYMEKSIKK